jgi:hypothetical protein
LKPDYGSDGHLPIGWTLVGVLFRISYITNQAQLKQLTPKCK